MEDDSVVYTPAQPTSVSKIWMVALIFIVMITIGVTTNTNTQPHDVVQETNLKALIVTYNGLANALPPGQD